MNWTEVIEAVATDDVGKEDRIERVADIIFGARDATDAITGQATADNAIAIGQDFYRLNDWSEAQFCGRLGVPVRYFRRCPDYLREWNIDYWKGQVEEDRRWLLRTRPKAVRGILSAAYTPFNNADVLDAWSKSGGPAVPYDYEAWTSDTSFHLRATRPDSDHATEGLNVGVHISNSEVGARSLTINALVYRLVCSNGLIALVDGENIFSQRHIWIDRSALSERFAFAVRRALAVADEYATRLVASQKVDVTPEQVEAVIAERGYGDDHTALLLNSYEEESATAFALVNAVTFAAQALPTERRIEEETYAGALLARLAA